MIQGPIPTGFPEVENIADFHSGTEETVTVIKNMSPSILNFLLFKIHTTNQLIRNILVFQNA